MNHPVLPLSRVVRRSEVPEEGLAIHLQADESTRRELAAFLEIPAVEAFVADMTVERWHRNGLVVRGTIEARVVQSCVVTLRAVRNSVTESFEDHYAPDPASLEASSAEWPDPEDVEPLVNQQVDVGGLAVEHLVLGLDPYPRCEGAELEVGRDADEGALNNPFAALAALRKDSNSR